VVTKAEGQVVEALGGQPAMEVLHTSLATLSPKDRELAQQGSIYIFIALIFL